MPAFIHAEVNWTEPPEVVSHGVRLMLDAVVGHPWASTSVLDLSDHSVNCVMGLQCAVSTGGSPGDPAGGQQTFHIVADLDLHSRGELESRLGLSPAERRSLSTEALIVRAYRRWGPGCAKHLLGDGSFALWDASEQRLTCWRDSTGVRPLYYHHEPGRRLVISSDLQSIAAHPAVPPRLDLAYTRSFLAAESFQHPTHTLIEGVRKVPAAHILVFDRSGLHLQRYWDPHSITERASFDDGDCVEELRSLLREAVNCRLPCTGEGAGAHLSGGLDSSSISLLATSLLEGKGHRLTTFSWAPPRDVVPAVEADERDLVEAAARFGAVRLEYTRLRPSDITEVQYRDVALRPRATLNFEVATSRHAVDAGVRTILSGWGGDEAIAFNGRGYFADLARRGRLGTIRRELRLRAQVQGGSLARAWKSRVFMPFLPDRVLPRGSKHSPVLPPELRSDFARLLDGVEALGNPFPRERPGVRRMQVALLEYGHLQYRMEAWAAHGAAIGLTYAFPLLDRRITEFALSLPPRMFFRDGWKRWLYRTAMDGILPDVIRWNPKKYDNAAARHLRDVLVEPAEVYREPLLERRGNPFVDVGVLLAEQDLQRQLRSASRGPAASLRSSRIGRGAWLAFTRLQPA